MMRSFRNALTNDAERLTEIAFAAKRTWNYPEEYFNIWNDELTITEKYIDDNVVLVAEEDELVVGFVSLVQVPVDKQFGNVKVAAGYWMDHLFVDPNFQHREIGFRLVGVIKQFCRNQGIESLMIFVDPHAIGFYEKVGARFVENSSSSIVGREIPVYRLDIK
ncbi:MAG: GNAT family N-acetyltransferase [Prolixibacteraceae bacterium]|nr:GNAT family N-acetyltransferase [Prolixibacteraceae bacterium]